MINRYRSIGRQIAAPTFQSIAKATTVSSVAEILAANKQIDEYLFETNKELQDALKGACVSVWSEKADNKRGFVNKATILLNGSKFFANVFGVKDAPVTKKDYTAEETAKLSFGYCKSGNDLVTTTKTNPTTGEVQNIPVIYVNLA